MYKNLTFKKLIKVSIIVFVFLSMLLTEGGMLRAQNSPSVEEADSDAPIIEAVETPQNEVTIKAKKIYKNDSYPTENIEVRPIDANALTKARQGLDYRKPIQKQQQEERAEKRRKEKQQGNIEAVKPPLPPTDWSALGKILTWVFIAIAVGLIVWLVIKAVKEGNIFVPNNRKIKLNSEVIDIEHIEQNLDQIDDLDPIIAQAIRQGNYGLAIRLYYLAILKALSNNNAISWKRDKTNRTYVEEMRNHTFFEPFRNTTRLFERVWYGNMLLQVTDFERIKPDFDQLLRGVKNLNTTNKN